MLRCSGAGMGAATHQLQAMRCPPWKLVLEALERKLDSSKLSPRSYAACRRVRSEKGEVGAASSVDEG